MLFNSYEFLFLFLPIILIGYYLVFRRARLVFLTAMSYLFYGWWDYRFCALMIVSTFIDYFAGRQIAASSGLRARRLWLAVSVVSNLALLGFFKYFDLAASTVNGLANFFGADESVLPLLRVTLPVGISFYTFQSMSYSIDIYRGAAKPTRGFWDFACYVALFPQLVAGPIVRYHELAEQLTNRTHTVSKAALGVTMFILGLAKKVILADAAALIAEEVFAASAPAMLSSWLGVLSYAVQIYFDFSGYSDMAVGLGLMLGFSFPQNFDSPYKAVSITDFWHRWHMSLSTWLRDYLYVPLGGNRLGVHRTYINLFLTMLLGGLWHGASWTFMLWGAYHGALLAIERAIGKRGLLWWAPTVVQRAGTFILVLFGWVLFRAGSMEKVGDMLSGLIGIRGVGLLNSSYIYEHAMSLTMLVISLGVIWFLPNTWQIRWPFLDESRAGWALSLGMALAAILVVAIGVILTNASSPFLYFQF